MTSIKFEEHEVEYIRAALAMDDYGDAQAFIMDKITAELGMDRETPSTINIEVNLYSTESMEQHGVAIHKALTAARKSGLIS